MRTFNRSRQLVLAAGMVGALLFVLLVEGCSLTRAPSAPSGAQTSSKPYGSLTVATDLRSLDPHAVGGGAFHGAPVAVFDSLTELHSDGNVIPGIAERWEISPDGLTHTFFIRKGVKFHDGSDLTGADVKFSLERVLSPKSTHVDASNWRTLMESVQSKDDYTVLIRLKKPQFELLKGFSDFTGSVAVVPKKYIEEKGEAYFEKNPIGSGPWKVVANEAGSRVDLEAVESHWRKVPQFKNVTLRHILEEGVKVAMLKTGELDLADVSPDSAADLKAAGVRLLNHQRGGAQTLMYIFHDVDNPKAHALGNVMARKALSLSTNRQEMSDHLFRGYAEPSVLASVRPAAFFWDAAVLKPDPYDPEQAKSLLAKAGYPDGFTLKLWDTKVAENLPEALASYWRKIGARAEVVNIDFTSGLRPMFLPKQTPPIWGSIWVTLTKQRGFEFERMAQFHHSVLSSAKLTRNLELDALIEKVPTITDPAEKKRTALKAAAMAKDEYGNVALLDHATLFAISSSIGGMTPIVNIASPVPSLETITHAK